MGTRTREGAPPVIGAELKGALPSWGVGKSSLTFLSLISGVAGGGERGAHRERRLQEIWVSLSISDLSVKTSGSIIKQHVGCASTKRAGWSCLVCLFCSAQSAGWWWLWLWLWCELCRWHLLGLVVSGEKRSGPCVLLQVSVLRGRRLFVSEILGSVEMSCLSSENISCFFKCNTVTRGVTCCTQQGFRVGGAPPLGCSDVQFVGLYCFVHFITDKIHKPLNVLGQSVVMCLMLHEVKSVGNIRLSLWSV